MWWGRLLTRTGVATIVVAFCILAFQFLLWLRDGFWTPLDFQLLAEVVLKKEVATGGLTWLGVQKLLEWMPEFPLTLALVVMLALQQLIEGILAMPLSLALVTIGGVFILYGAAWKRAASSEPGQASQR
jgi:hypothetical protein